MQIHLMHFSETSPLDSFKSPETGPSDSTEIIKYPTVLKCN